MSILDGLVKTVKNDSGVKTTGLKYGSSSNQMYDDLFKANPYVGLTYNKSPFQSILSSLGFRTDYDRWNEEAQVNAAEYDAQVASIMQQNDYNDPSSEASRLKAAGINPALTGLQGVESSASPVQDPQGMSAGTPESGEFGQVTQMLWNFGTSVLSAYQMATGLAKDVLTFKQMKNAVDSQDIGLAKDFMSYAGDIVRGMAPDRPFDNDENYRSHLSKVSGALSDFPNKMRFNRRQRRIWKSVIENRWWNSDDFKNLISSWRETSDNANELSRKHQFFRYGRAPGKDGQPFDEFASFRIISDELGKLADETWKAQQKSFKAVADKDSAVSKFDTEVAQAASGYRDQGTGLTGAQTKVWSDMSTYNLNAQTAATEKAINSTMYRIVNELERQANDGDLLSAGLLLAFNIFKLSNWKVK